MAFSISGLSLPSVFRYKSSILARKPRFHSFSVRSSNDVSSEVGSGGDGSDSSKRPKRLSEQSTWEAKDSEGKDYLYRLGNEADNMNIAVGARAGVIDDLFAGNFLGKDCKYPRFVTFFFLSFFHFLGYAFSFLDVLLSLFYFFCSGHCV